MNFIEFNILEGTSNVYIQGRYFTLLSPKTIYNSAKYAINYEHHMKVELTRFYMNDLKFIQSLHVHETSFVQQNASVIL